MIDGALLLKTLLSANWTNTNTDSKTPTFQEWYEKRANIPFLAETDLVLTYDRDTADEKNAQLGNSAREVVYRSSIDIRTNYSKAHAYNMTKETKSIIRSNVNYSVPAAVSYGDSGQQVTLEIGTIQYFNNNGESSSNELYKNFRRVMEITMTSYNEAI